MLRTRRTFNTLMLLMALAVITQRVLTPFIVPPLLVHADGTLEICSWQGSSERLVFNNQGERLKSLQPNHPCPECTTSPALSQQADLFLPESPQQAVSQARVRSASKPGDHLRPPPRAPPLQA
ncbi:hypothetical protein [Marinospirillum sp.]|uniref:hypothetical protein n=1 Tax=Marinospirillum sp. TaxID=2183934 RepID=UPI00384CA10E